MTEKRLNPGDELAIAKHTYDVQYSPIDLGAVGPPPSEDLPNDFMKQSLLERAGLNLRKAAPASSPSPARDSDAPRQRFDVLSDTPGQIRDPNKPV